MSAHQIPGAPADPVHVVVVGSANMDLILRVDALPAPGETVLGGDTVFRPGGKGANQAVAAARAGALVGFVGCVGDDADGIAIRDDLARAGVNTDLLFTLEDRRTGMAVVLVGPSGENQIAVSPGANHGLAVADVDRARAMIDGAAVLLLQLEVPPEVVRRAVQVASESGTTVVLNLSPAVAVDGDTLAKVDVLVVNRGEAAFLLESAAGADIALGDIADRLRDLGPAAVVVTAGSAGAACATAGAIVPIEPVAVAVVDTTGAGDAFAGTLATELSRGTDLVTAVRRANLAGAAAVQRPGARDATGVGVDRLSC
jgi:ribokinase